MIHIILILTLGFGYNLQGQFTQVELFTGFDKIDFTLLSSYAINESQTFSITTLTFLQKYNDRENQGFDEVGVQPTLFWNINKYVSIGPSIYYNSFAGFSERISAKFTLKSTRILFVAIHTIAYSHQKDASIAELFAQFQFNQPISNHLFFCLNGQVLTVWDVFKTHSRSYQQLRVGLSVNGHQFGTGIDFDQYGTDPIKKSSIGLYYRKNL